MTNKKRLVFIGLILALALVAGIRLYPRSKAPTVGKVAAGAGKSVPSGKNTIQPNAKSGPAAQTSAGSGAGLSSAKPPPDDNPYIQYPENLLEALGIDPKTVVQNRDAYKKTVVHVEWMARLNSVLRNLDPEKKAAMIANHTAHLYIKDLLNEAYLSGRIDHDTFMKAVADLMKWHQATYAEMLTPAEYEALFEVKPEAAEGLIDEVLAATPRYGFITNQSLPAAEIANQVQGYKLEQVDTHFKKMILDQERISKKIDKGEMTPEQAREAMHKSQLAFVAKCKELLTEEEIATIFGSLSALESGAAETEPPPVKGDEDVAELGFMIENPDTSVEMVKTRVDKTKREDVKFFYQEWYKEKEALIARLDAGEIKEDVFENLSNEMDRTLAENCRSVLNEEEYRLIFDREGGGAAQTGNPASSETEKTRPSDPSPEE